LVLLQLIQQFYNTVRIKLNKQTPVPNTMKSEQEQQIQIQFTIKIQTIGREVN